MKNIKKKIAAVIAVVMMVFIFAPAQSASAYSSTYTEKHCHTYDAMGMVGRTVTSCLTVGWRTQDDGTGIRVEDVKFDGDCSELEGNGYNGYKNGYVKAAYPSNPGGAGPYWTDASTANTPYLNCGQWYDTELKIDSSKAIISGNVWLRVDNSPDFEDNWNGFAICQYNNC